MIQIWRSQKSTIGFAVTACATRIDHDWQLHDEGCVSENGSGRSKMIRCRKNGSRPTQSRSRERQERRVVLASAYSAGALSSLR
jgi:hypothetical protein